MKICSPIRIEFPFIKDKRMISSGEFHKFFQSQKPEGYAQHQAYKQSHLP